MGKPRARGYGHHNDDEGLRLCERGTAPIPNRRRLREECRRPVDNVALHASKEHSHVCRKERSRERLHPRWPGGIFPQVLRHTKDLVGHDRQLQHEVGGRLDLGQSTRMTTFVFTNLFLFSVGLAGVVLNRKHTILILMCLEIMLLAVNVNLITFSIFLDDMVGQIFALLVLTVAAAESSIGLAVLVAYSRRRGTISVTAPPVLRG